LILLDFSNVVIGNICSSIRDEKKMDEELIRHVVLNSIVNYNKKFSRQYGELVICIDSGSWRKKVFPYYKAHRSEDRDDSDIDWKALYVIVNKLIAELKDVFPYKVIAVDDAEGDDVIAQLVLHKYFDEKIMIVSADHDFKQLHSDSVKQYSPMTKDSVKADKASEYLKIHIIKGDSGDGIPNILSPANFLVEKKKAKKLLAETQDEKYLDKAKGRQKSVTQKKLDVWLQQKPEQFCDEDQLKRYRENEHIIDLRNCPDELKKEIVSEHRNYIKNDRSKIMNYMIKHKLKELTNSITDF